VVSPLSLRLLAQRYSRPTANYKICVEVDNSPRRDVTLEIGIDRANNGIFETKSLSGDREVLVSMNPVGPDGAVVFKTETREWCTDFDLTSILGERKLRARLLLNGGPLVVVDENGNKQVQVDRLITVSDSPPDSGSFIDPPPNLAKGKPLQVKAKGSDKYTGIQRVNFFLGKPAQDKVPPDAQIVKGQRNAEDIWSASVPIPAESKSVTVSAQFVNGVELSSFDTITVDIVDPMNVAPMGVPPAGGTIKGKVVRGALGQPGLEVTLTDAAGAAKGKTKTNDAGEFTFKDVPPGRYKVSGSVPANSLKGEAEVTVVAGKTAEATIELFLRFTR
jgi:hypothetical protein